jgi:hypothetical protein
MDDENRNRGEFGDGTAMNDKCKRQGKEKDKVIIPTASSLLYAPELHGIIDRYQKSKLQELPAQRIETSY